MKAVWARGASWTSVRREGEETFKIEAKTRTANPRDGRAVSSVLNYRSIIITKRRSR